MISTRKSRVVMFTATFAAFLSTFNETFLNVALTPIMAQFAITSATAQWLTTAFSLVAAVMVPITGFLYQKVPTNRLFCISVSILLVGSILGAAAPSFGLLLAARIMQAIGAGMMPPLAMNVVLAIAPKGKLGTYMGLVGAMTTLGPSTSPVLSGVVLSVGTWHHLFLMIAILSVVLLVFGMTSLSNVANLTNPHLDAASVVLISLALVGIMYGISTAFSGSPVFAAGSFVVGIVCLVAFIRRQSRLEEPLLDFSPFKVPSFRIGIASLLIALMTVFAMNIVLPLYMQGVLGFTALGAALTLFPAVACAAILSPVCGRVYDKFGARILLPAGMVLMIVFSLVLGLSAPTSAVLISLIYIPVIAGSAFSIGPAQTYALDGLDSRVRPHGVVAVSTTFQIAACTGTALFVGLFSNIQAAQLATGATQAAAATTGFSAAAILGGAIALVGLVVTSRIGAANKRTQAGRAAQSPADTAKVSVAQGIPQFSTDGASLSAQALDDVMKREVFSVAEDASVLDALRCMVNNGTSGIPILSQDGKPAGFIVDGDIMRYLADGDPDRIEIVTVYTLWSRGIPLDEKVEELRTINVMELATRKVVSVERDAGFAEVCRILSSKTIKKVPVTEKGRVVGTVSRSDLMRYLLGTRPMQPLAEGAK